MDTESQRGKDSTKYYETREHQRLSTPPWCSHQCKNVKWLLELGLVANQMRAKKMKQLRYELDHPGAAYHGGLALYLRGRVGNIKRQASISSANSKTLSSTYPALKLLLVDFRGDASRRWLRRASNKIAIIGQTCCRILRSDEIPRPFSYMKYVKVLS